MKTQVLYREPPGKPQIVSCSVVSDSFATPWTVALPGSSVLELSWQEYCSGKPFLSLRDLPGPGIKLGSPALQVGPLLSEHQAGLKKKKVVFVSQMRQWRPRDAQFCPGMPGSAQGHEFPSFLRYLPVMSFWASFFISELQPPFSKTG